MQQVGIETKTVGRESIEAAPVRPLGWTGCEKTVFDDGSFSLLDGFVDAGPENTNRNGRRKADNVTTHLMRLYKELGPAFLQRLRGSFAIALWDSKAQKLILAADPFATRSLFYWSNQKVIAFAPRVSCFSEHIEIPRDIDPNAIYFYLNHSFVPGPFTVYREIKKLEPGQYLLWENGKASVQRYWDMTYPEDRRVSEAAVADDLMTAVRESVRFHLQHLDQQLLESGAFLSGGTDSSTLVGLISLVTQKRVKTFSVGFEEERYNEIHYARTAASHFSSEAHEYFVKPHEALDAILLLGREYDQPFGNSSAIPTYFCLKLARDAGVKTMFAGDGGDELFGGNERSVGEKIFALYQAVPSSLRWGIDRVARVLPPVYPWRKIRNYVQKANQAVPDRFFSYQQYFRDHATEYFTDEFREILDPEVSLRIPREHYERVGDVNPLNRLLYMDLKLAIADNDLVKVNGTAKCLGIQVQYPYLDKLVALVSGRIPAKLKLKGWTKRYIFKKAFENLLPKEILKKKKHGFGLPVGDWLRTDPGFRDLARSLLLEPRAVNRGYFKQPAMEELLKKHDQDSTSYYGSQVWNLMMLELWHRSHVDR